MDPARGPCSVHGSTAPLPLSIPVGISYKSGLPLTSLQDDGQKLPPQYCYGIYRPHAHPADHLKRKVWNMHCIPWSCPLSPLSLGPLVVCLCPPRPWRSSEVQSRDFGAGPLGGACRIFPPTGSFDTAHVSPLWAPRGCPCTGGKAPSPPGLYAAAAAAAAACLPQRALCPSVRPLQHPDSILRRISLFASCLPNPARSSLPLFLLCFSPRSHWPVGYTPRLCH